MKAFFLLGLYVVAAMHLEPLSLFQMLLGCSLGAGVAGAWAAAYKAWKASLAPRSILAAACMEGLGTAIMAVVASLMMSPLLKNGGDDLPYAVIGACCGLSALGGVAGWATILPGLVRRVLRRSDGDDSRD